MVGTSLLAQAVSLSTTGGVGTISMITGLAVFLYIVYKVLVKKDETARRKLVGLRGLVPAVVLAIMTFIPASVLALFGPAQTLVTAVFSIMTAGLVGYLLAWVTLHVVDWVQENILPE